MEIGKLYGTLKVIWNAFDTLRVLFHQILKFLQNLESHSVSLKKVKLKSKLLARSVFKAGRVCKLSCPES